MPPIKLTTDELDDLIYYARTGDLAALTSTLTSLSTFHSTPAYQIVCASIDQDDDASNSTFSSGCCLLHWPAANGNEEVLSYLLSLLKAPQNATEGKMTAEQGLLDHKNSSGNTPLHWAAVNGYIKCVKILVAAGADPTITNKAGHDALYEADCSGKDGGREVTEWMLAHCEGVEKGMSGESGKGERVEEDLVVMEDEVIEKTSST
jgi:uncharacterized protein